jgi:hypothetical protein
LVIGAPYGYLDASPRFQGSRKLNPELEQLRGIGSGRSSGRRQCKVFLLPVLHDQKFQAGSPTQRAGISPPSDFSNVRWASHGGLVQKGRAMTTRRQFMISAPVAATAFALGDTFFLEAGSAQAQQIDPLQGHFHPKGKAPSTFTLEVRQFPGRRLRNSRGRDGPDR